MQLAPGQFGPFDYRTQREKLPVVENIHFNKDVEGLRRGQSSSNIESDIEFVLRYFPNHHRALDAMGRLSVKRNVARLRYASLPTECYYVNAIAFAPDDPKVRLVYGIYLSKTGKARDALAQFHEAERLGANDANTYYNLGLMYLHVKDYGNALEYAKKAYGQGFPLPGLRDKLKAAGKWSG